jgi:leucyl-tRNA synthetase
VLANEQVVDGGCWRCGTPVTQKDLEQWFFRITAYADDLLEGAEHLSKWPDKVLTMQRNWIGRSEGARVKFAAASAAAAPAAVSASAADIEVFTTRIDTIYGATFVMLAPEHPLVATFADESADPDGFRANVSRFRGQDRAGRISGEVEKEGFFTGRFVTNPFTQQPVPVWIANFVLGEYGTGAVMAVPAHDERDYEFAKKYNLPIRVVVRPVDGEAASVETMTEAVSNDGVLVNSGEWDGLSSEDARRQLTAEAGARGDCAVPAQRLGHLAAALLGHADSDDSLPRSRHCRGAGRSAAREAAGAGAVQRTRRFAARPGARVRQRALSDVREAGAA